MFLCKHTRNEFEVCVCEFAPLQKKRWQLAKGRQCRGNPDLAKLELEIVCLAPVGSAQEECETFVWT